MNNVAKLSDYRDRKTKITQEDDNIGNGTVSGVAELSDRRDKKIGNITDAIIFGRDANGAINYPPLPEDDEAWAKAIKANQDENFKYAQAAQETNRPVGRTVMKQGSAAIAMHGAMRAGDMLVTAEGSISANHPGLPQGVAEQAPPVSHDDIA